MHKTKFQKRTVFLWFYLVFALLPIYWMINMSFKTNNEILAGFTLFPEHFTWANYETILTDPAWYSGYINSLIYVLINTVISVLVALPVPLGSLDARPLEAPPGSRFEADFGAFGRVDIAFG